MPDIETTHAVHATGDSTSLPGGRSRQTANGVPILELRDDLAAKVSASAAAAVDDEQETVYLIGEKVWLHNPSPADGIATDDDVVVFTIGAETLDEASKSVVGLFEAQFGTAAPSWVESTSDDLADVISDHYHGACENRNKESA
jgi:hypothetical protein